MSATRPTPFRPAPLRIANALGRGLRRVGWRGVPLDEVELLAKARRATGLEDFGRESFRPGLRKLLESLEQDARLNPFGRYFARRQVFELLTQRLRLHDYRARYPEVAAQEVRSPLFILGLPRTGTTLLHELLAQDPAHRAPLSWEVDDPGKPPERDSHASDPRIALCEARMGQLRRLAPGFQAIHPIGAELPQECIVITACEFMSLRFEMCFDVASYQRWLPEQDMRPAYRMHRRFLQHLQSRYAKQRWVLKSPGHLGPVDALLNVYPDAMIVQTHRDPLRAIPSVSSLEATMRGIASDDLDLRALGQQQLWLWSTLLEQGMRARAARPDRAAQFLDLHYHEVAADPLGSVRRIYRHFDLALGPVAEARMRAHLVAHPRYEHGVHRYSLQAFGLEDDAVNRAFKAYREHYDVEKE